MVGHMLAARQTPELVLASAHQKFFKFILPNVPACAHEESHSKSLHPPLLQHQGVISWNLYATRGQFLKGSLLCFFLTCAFHRFCIERAVIRAFELN